MNPIHSRCGISSRSFVYISHVTSWVVLCRYYQRLVCVGIIRGSVRVQQQFLKRAVRVS